MFAPFYSTRLHFLNTIFKYFSHWNFDIGKCNKYVNLLLYKALPYKILTFVSLYWEFSIEALKAHHVLLDLEGLRFVPLMLMPWFYCKIWVFSIKRHVPHHLVLIVNFGQSIIFFCLLVWLDNMTFNLLKLKFLY